MPLSEHEQRVLEQMEKALSAEDPNFASSMVTKTPERVQRSRAAVGVLAALAGLGLILAGVSTNLIWLGGIGFAAMVLGLAWAFRPKPTPQLKAVDSTNPPRTPKGSKASRNHPSMGGGSAPGAGGKQGGFMDRLEQRWDKRRDDGPV